MVLLISEDLMMSSTVSAAVRADGGTFRFVSSVERAYAKLEGSDCELLLVDLQTAELDWSGLGDLIAKVPRAVAYAQHVNVDALSKAREMSFENVLTRGQLHAGVAEVVTSA